MQDAVMPDAPGVPAVDPIPHTGETITLFDAARNVLTQNDRGDYTVPVARLYPHQWLWDSCFIAIGMRHYDTERAKNEIYSLLRGQWANGMLPNIIFNDGNRCRT